MVIDTVPVMWMCAAISAGSPIRVMFFNSEAGGRALEVRIISLAEVCAARRDCYGASGRAWPVNDL